MIPRYHLNYCPYQKAVTQNQLLSNAQVRRTYWTICLCPYKQIPFRLRLIKCYSWKFILQGSQLSSLSGSDNSHYFSSSSPLHQILISLPQLKKNVQKFFILLFFYTSRGFFIAYSKASTNALVAARHADSVPARTAPLEFACDGGYQYLATRVFPAFNALSNA